MTDYRALMCEDLQEDLDMDTMESDYGDMIDSVACGDTELENVSEDVNRLIGEDEDDINDDNFDGAELESFKDDFLDTGDKLKYVY